MTIIDFNKKSESKKDEQIAKAAETVGKQINSTVMNLIDLVHFPAFAEILMLEVEALAALKSGNLDLEKFVKGFHDLVSNCMAERTTGMDHIKSMIDETNFPKLPK